MKPISDPGKSLNFSDRDFLAGYFSEYSHDTLPDQAAQRYLRLITDDENKEYVDRMKLGMLAAQTILDRHKLEPEELEQILGLVEDPELRKTREISQLEDLMFKQRITFNLRWLLLVVLIAGAVAFIFMKQPQTPDSKIDLIDSLTYEARAAIADSDKRLDFAAKNHADLENYIKLLNLPFPIKVNQLQGTGWVAVGASRLDYDGDTILMVKYQNKVLDDAIFLFARAGDLEDLPKPYPGFLGSFMYFTFTNEKQNIIVWEKGPTSYILIGTRAAQELAELASSD